MAHAVSARSPSRWPLSVQLMLAVLGLEAMVVLGYFLATPATVERLRYVVYPFVWINAVLWAWLHTDVPPASRRRNLVAGAVAAAYFLLLANWGGLVVLTDGGHHGVLESALGVDVLSGSPMVARVRFVTRTFAVSVIPYRLVGYLGLALLVYAAVLDVSGAVVSGAVGVLSCLSCSFPIVASLLTGVWGGSVTLMSTVYAHSLDLSTLAFLLSVGLLYWRPGFPSLGSRRESGDCG